MRPDPARVAGRFLEAGASDWTKPEFDDPGVSTVVITQYKPAQDIDLDGIDSFHVIWHGELSGPDPGERDPYFAAYPVEADFPTLQAARSAVERAFKKKYGRR
jgi:hypothetical protein